MPDVLFTPNLQRHIKCRDVTVEGATVLDVLNAAFELNPGLKQYILDEHDRTRRHINVFVNGQPVKDRIHLSDGLTPSDEVYVMQALSGG